MKGIGIDTNAVTFASIKSVEALVKESIKRILLTRPGERVGHPNFGMGVQRYVFGNISYLSSKKFKEDFTFALLAQETRININYFNFLQTDTNSIQFVLNYSVKDQYIEDEAIENQTIEINFRGA